MLTGSMGANCCDHRPGQLQDPGYRRVLWFALVINAAMFMIEALAGLSAGSVSLQADALDFFADAGNYGITLFVIGMTLRYRALAALTKGATMGVFGVWVVGATIWQAVHGALPRAGTMGTVGFCAWPPMQSSSRCYGHTEAATATGDPCGCAHATM